MPVPFIHPFECLLFCRDRQNCIPFKASTGTGTGKLPSFTCHGSHLGNRTRTTTLPRWQATITSGGNGAGDENRTRIFGLETRKLSVSRHPQRPASPHYTIVPTVSHSPSVMRMAGKRSLLVDPLGFEPRPNTVQACRSPVKLQAHGGVAGIRTQILASWRDGVTARVVDHHHLPHGTSLERHTGFEPVSYAWHAQIFPLDQCRSVKPPPRMTSRIERHCTVSLSLDPARRCFLGLRLRAWLKVGRDAEIRTQTARFWRPACRRNTSPLRQT